MSNLSAEQLFITETAQALLENPKALFLNLALYQVWEITGRDSRQLVQQLVGDVAEKIAPLQSIDFIFTGYQYSVLCLGQSFRLGLYGELERYGGLSFEQTIEQARIGLQAKASCIKMSVLAFSDKALDLLPKIVVMQDLLPNSAVWVTIAENPALIWRHQLLSLPIWELHTTLANIESIKVKLINIDTPHQLGSLLD